MIAPATKTDGSHAAVPEERVAVASEHPGKPISQSRMYPVEKQPPAGALMHSGAPWLRFWFRPELLVLLGIFALFYFYKLANYSLQIDDEWAFVRTTPDVWLEQGRWGAYLVERWLLPNPSIPFLATFLFGLFASSGYLLLLAAHGVSRPGPLHYLAFPLFIAFPTWIHLVAFAANAAAAGLAMLICCLGTWAYSRFIAQRHVKDAPNWRFLGLLALTVAIVVSIYQTFAVVAAVLALGILLVRSLRQPSGPGALFLDLLLLMAALLVGLVLYKLVDGLFLALTGIQGGGYLGSSPSVHQFLGDPAGMILLALKEMLGVYGGYSGYFGVSAPGFPFVIIVGTLAVILTARRSSWREFVCTLLIATVLLIAPFVLDLFLGRMPVRSMVAVPSVFWLFAIIGLSNGRRWLEMLASVALVAALFSTLHTTNDMQAIDSAVRAHDRHLSAQIYQRIAQADADFDRTRVLALDIHGAVPFVPIHYGRPFSSTWGYSFFEWDGGNLQRIIAYMQLQGYSNFVAATPQQRQANFEQFQMMPVWPAAGSVRVNDGVVLVKLGD